MNASTAAASNVDRPLSPRGCLRLSWIGFRDARRAVMPDKGWTPAAHLIRSAAITSVTSRQEQLGQQEAQLRVERAGVEAQLEAAQQQCATARQALQSLATQVDAERLPERAVSGEPKLIRSLIVAKAEADLRATRTAALSSHQASVNHRDGLLARQAEILKRIDQLGPEFLHYARRVAAQADLRIAYYATVFVRWHKDRQGLRPLLPFGRVSDEIDRLIDSTSLGRGSGPSPTPPTSASTRKE